MNNDLRFAMPRGPGGMSLKMYLLKVFTDRHCSGDVLSLGANLFELQFICRYIL